MMLFRFKNPTDRVVSFWDISVLGHRILRSDFFPHDFATSDYIRRTIHLLHRKVKIWSSESDRVRVNLILMSQCGGTGFWCRTDLTDVPGTGFCFTKLSEVLVTGIDVEPIPVPAPVHTSIPAPAVQALMYRFYRSVRCRYRCRTELYRSVRYQ